MLHWKISEVVPKAGQKAMKLHYIKPYTYDLFIRTVVQ